MTKMEIKIEISGKLGTEMYLHRTGTIQLHLTSKLKTFEVFRKGCIHFCTAEEQASRFAI